MPLSTSDHLVQKRTITKGPGAKEWALAMISESHNLQITIRGHTSTCTCPRDNICDDCRKTSGSNLLVVGTFNPDLEQRAFIYWGFIPIKGVEILMDGGRIAPEEDERVARPRAGTQLIYGWYNPYDSRSRGWIGPMDHSFEELFKLFNNTHLIRRTFDVSEENWARIEGKEIKMHPDRLWGHLREKTDFSMALIREHDKAKGIAQIDVLSATHHQHGIKFNLNMRFTQEGTSAYRIQYREATVVVRSSNGNWSGITAPADNGPHFFVPVGIADNH